MTDFTIPSARVPVELLFFCVLVSFLYFSWWLRPNQADNLILYILLFIGEIYHLIMAYTFWYTVWPRPNLLPGPEGGTFKRGSFPAVDVFITVAGEPADVVRQTVTAAKAIDYPRFTVHVLNDGFVAEKDNWRDIEKLCRELKVNHIMRTVKGGAKSGNINHALKQTGGELVAIFDADMVPRPEFLKKTVPYFADKKCGFVQTPQYYQNQGQNSVTAGAWDQQKFFFGPIMAGKARDNAAFICGTNVLISRQALSDVGGLAENNIAEDFITSIYIHRRGWHSYYLEEVLAAGLAPLDILAYNQQQLRWSRGSLEVLFTQNPLTTSGLSWPQRFLYLASSLYYLNGLIILIDIAMPLVYLFTGLQPVVVSTGSFAVYFIPFMFLSLYTLSLASQNNLTLAAYSFSYASWYIQLVALLSILMRRKIAFAVTPKNFQKVNPVPLVLPHLIYVVLFLSALAVALHREFLTPSVITNLAWGLFSILLFAPYIVSAFYA